MDGRDAKAEDEAELLVLLLRCMRPDILFKTLQLKVAAYTICVPENEDGRGGDANETRAMDDRRWTKTGNYGARVHASHRE